MTHVDAATLPVEFQDQIVAITSRMRVSGPVILILRFGERPDGGRLDGGRLARAARLLVDAEPILGCRFEMGAEGPVWRRRGDSDGVAWFEQGEAADYEAAVTRVLGLEEPVEGRNLIVRLFSLPEGDVLIVTVSHVVADGSAAYECVYRLAGLYTALRDDPGHRPEPNLASRDSFEWMAGFTLRHKARTLLRDLGELRHVRTRIMGVRPEHDLAGWLALPRRSPCFVERRIEPEELEAIDRLAAAHGCGRMDVLVAGLARAYADFVGGAPGEAFRVIMPSNLRRFTAGARRPPIRNMAGFATMTFDAAREAPFGRTLEGAVREAARVKAGLSGAMNPVAAALLGRMSFARKQRMIEGAIRRGMGKPAPPTFTNVGRLHEGRARFDAAGPETVMLLGGAYPMPMLVVGGVEYRRSLSLAVAFQEDGIPRARMQGLVDDMVNQIPTGG